MTISTSSGTSAGSGLRSPVLRVVLVAVLSLLLVASLVWLVAEVLARRDGGVASSSGSTSLSPAVARDREDVMSVAGTFATRTHTYGPDDLADGRLTAYEERVKELLTTSFATEFDEFVQAPLLYVKETQRDQTAEVYGTGVVSLSDDRAEALVAGAYTTTWFTGTEREVTEDPIQFRWTVDLVKVEGEWRVDGFRQVSSAVSGTGPGDSGPTPEEVPTP